MNIKAMASLLIGIVLSACGCTKYASKYTCSYVENQANFEVWYWRHLQLEAEKDNRMIGHATGVKQCEANARAFAAAIGEPFQDRAYICILTIDGHHVEKHRNLSGPDA